MSDFFLKSAGHCFLCLQRIIWQNEETKKVYSFQYPSHYLGVDKTKVFKENATIQPELVKTVKNSRLKVELCLECAEINENFTKLYQDLERIQMGVASCLRTILEKLNQVGGEEGRYLKEFQRSAEENGMDKEKIDIIQRVRMETLQKCMLKLNSASPRVKLERIAALEPSNTEKSEENRDASHSGLQTEAPPPSLQRFEEIKPTDEARDDDFADLPPTLSPEEQLPNSPVPELQRKLSLGLRLRNQVKQMPAKTVGNEENRKFCTQCDKSFANSKHLSRHIQTVHFPKRFNCHLCKKSFSRKDSLVEHMKKTKHVLKKAAPQQKKQLKSSAAGKTYSKPDGKIRPQTTADGNKRKCQYCRKWLRVTSIARHIRSVHLNVRFNCHLCNVSCSEAYALKRHLKAKHNFIMDKVKKVETMAKDKQGRYLCQDCRKPFSSKGSLQRHVISVHLKRRFNCHLCNISFSQSYRLTLHIRSKHKQRSKTEDVKSSPKKVNKTNKAAPIVSNQPGRKCGSCSKAFPTKSKLSRHIEDVHLKLLRFQCHLCDLKYQRKDSLRRHLRNIHNCMEPVKEMQPKPTSPKKFKSTFSASALARATFLRKGSTNRTLRSMNETSTPSEPEVLTVEEFELPALEEEEKGEEAFVEEVEEDESIPAGEETESVFDYSSNPVDSIENGDSVDDAMEDLISEYPIAPNTEMEMSLETTSAPSSKENQAPAADEDEDDVGGAVFCKICKMGFNSKEHLANHVSQLHNKFHNGNLTIPQFVCDLCSKTFTMQANLIAHKLTAHNNNQY